MNRKIKKSKVSYQKLEITINLRTYNVDFTDKGFRIDMIQEGSDWSVKT